MRVRFGAVLPMMVVLCLFGACNDSVDAGAVGAPQSARSAQSSACRGPQDCGKDALCVANERDPSEGVCRTRCAMNGTDLCGQEMHCAEVVGNDGDRAAVCLNADAHSQQSWQSCNQQRACGEGERCLYLDTILGARCVPLCATRRDCGGEGLRCALHWDGADGGMSGCVRSCVIDADCAAGWHCEKGSSVSGLCVR